MILVSEVIAAMKHLNTVMKSDNKAGHQWQYFNNKRSENTFEKTRKAGKYYTNCMGGVIFAFKYAGLPGSALDWYGSCGKIVWTSKDAEKNAKKYFDIIPVKNKTVKQCIADGTLQAGDIITYMSMTHTNAYMGNNKSYDTGHAFCSGSGEGAAYIKWIGTTPYKAYKVAFIFRLKKPSMYRVQVGAYSRQVNAVRKMAEVAQQAGFECFMEQTDQIRVYCGSFEQEANAVARVKALTDAGIKGAFITGG